ncbi:MAG: hypothetical protein AB1778_02635 [Candidatus Bipolaricaulota bacterium]
MACLVLAGGAAHGQISGQFGLDFVARRIPSSLTGDLVLDTPSEFAELEFGIASSLRVSVRDSAIGGALDAATNMAGPEHGVATGDLRIEPFRLLGVLFEDVTLACEMWMAVPFEAVTDVNNLPNAIVIPYGDIFFVTSRLTSSFDVGGFHFRHLLMILDTSFPNPNASYDPLFYEFADQTFSCGGILDVSWSSQLGLSLSLSAGFNASPGATVVKGYSAAGRVDPGNYYLNGSVGGFELCDFAVGPLFLMDPRIGISFSVSTTQTLSATLSFSAKVAEGIGLGASMTLFRGPTEVRGLSLSGSFACIQFGLQLDELEVTSLSMGCNTPFSLGALNGGFDIRATGLERGLTGLSTRLNVSHGQFSASTGITFAQRGARFGFASLATQFTFRFSPGTISLQATFGRYGLTRASISTGVTL